MTYERRTPADSTTKAGRIPAIRGGLSGRTPRRPADRAGRRSRGTASTHRRRAPSWRGLSGATPSWRSATTRAPTCSPTSSSRRSGCRTWAAYAFAIDGRGTGRSTVALHRPSALVRVSSRADARPLGDAPTAAPSTPTSGFRTWGSGQPAYNPLSYHNGTVWPHDSALAAWGLARAGYWEDCERLARSLIEASSSFDYSLPEVFAGFARDETAFPIAYPTAARPQAWAAGARSLPHAAARLAPRPRFPAAGQRRSVAAAALARRHATRRSARLR